MTKKVALLIAYIALLVELATYVAHDTGRLTEGRLYLTLLLVASAALFGSVVWLAYLRSHTKKV